MGQHKSPQKAAASPKARQRKEKRSGPKRALSAYFFFNKARREQIVKEDPSMRSNVTEISKIIGAEWRNLSDEEKAPYLEEHAKDKLRYQREKEEFAAGSGASSSTGWEGGSTSTRGPVAKKRRTGPGGSASGASNTNVSRARIEEEEDEEDEMEEEEEDGENEGENVGDESWDEDAPEESRDSKTEQSRRAAASQRGRVTSQRRRAASRRVVKQAEQRTSATAVVGEEDDVPVEEDSADDEVDEDAEEADADSNVGAGVVEGRLVAGRSAPADDDDDDDEDNVDDDDDNDEVNDEAEDGEPGENDPPNTAVGVGPESLTEARGENFPDTDCSNDYAEDAGSGGGSGDENEDDVGGNDQEYDEGSDE